MFWYKKRQLQGVKKSISRSVKVNSHDLQEITYYPLKHDISCFGKKRQLQGVKLNSSYCLTTLATCKSTVRIYSTIEQAFGENVQVFVPGHDAGISRVLLHVECES